MVAKFGSAEDPEEKGKEGDKQPQSGRDGIQVMISDLADDGPHGDLYSLIRDAGTIPSMPDPPNLHHAVMAPLHIPTDASLQAFFEACTSGNLERVTGFVQGHNRPEDYLSRGLLIAADEGQAAVASYLLEQGARLESSPVPIMGARGGSLAIFKVLKEHGWNVETQGYKVLPIVVRDEPIVRWLLENGADPTRGEPRWNENDPQDDRNAGAALNVAASAGTIAVFDLLLNSGSRIETSVPLHMAAGNPAAGASSIPMIRHLLELGLDINGLDDVQGPYKLGTPLHYAVHHRVIEAAQFLIERGADPHKKNQWDYTPAESAVQDGDEVFIRMFEARDQQTQA